MKLCKKVDCISMMKSREYDETKKKRLSIKELEKQKEYDGKARLAPCKLSLVNQSEAQQESRL